MSRVKIQAKRIARQALSLAEFLLIGLIDEIDDFNFACRYPYATMGRSARLAREYYEDNERYYQECARKREMQRLKERKLITIRQEGDRAIVSLTNDGKIKAVKTIIKNTDRILPNGQFCLVSFDVPEAARDFRKELRRLLKGFKFKFLHGSVWQTERAVFNEVKELIILMKVERWVKAMLVIND